MTPTEVTKIQFAGPGRVQVVTEPMEFVLAPDEVLLQTRFSLVSTGTETAKLTGLQKVAYPFDTGNRACGTVVACGSDVRNVRVGDVGFSYTPHWSHAPARRLFVKAPREVPPQHVPFAGMASVGMTALRVGRVELGDQVVVVGLGLVGILTAQLCRIAGAHTVGVDMKPSRLRLAKACDLPAPVDASLPDVKARILEATAGREPDVVIEASGTPEGAIQALQLTGSQGEGNVVLLGSPRRSLDTDVTPLLNRVHLWRGGSVNLLGAHEWRYPLHRDPFHKHSIERNIEVVFQLMAEQRLCLEPLISHVAPPERAPEVFADLIDQPDTMVAALFDWTATDPRPG